MATAAGAAHYDRLQAALVLNTLEKLRLRITVTFPDRHLADVALEVGRVIELVEHQSSQSAPWHRFVRVASRVAIVMLVALILMAVVSAVGDGVAQVGPLRAVDWLPLVESGVNDVVFAAVAIFFLVTVPDRIQRRRTLETLHRLRSLAHIVDMHQMAKSPEELLPRRKNRPPGEAPAGAMTRAELARYYDYCSELLTIVSKAAALCAEQTTDAVVLDTVSEIEDLTTGMSRKIWQKISLLSTAHSGPQA